jgi:hypothetical protein
MVPATADCFLCDPVAVLWSAGDRSPLWPAATLRRSLVLNSSEPRQRQVATDKALSALQNHAA